MDLDFRKRALLRILLLGKINEISNFDSMYKEKLEMINLYIELYNKDYK